ncbi:MAG: hypothetical protein ACR2J6_07860 [Thermoleophilaceae bacterium]
MTAESHAQPLVCPSCGLRHRAAERFCSACAMPLTHAEVPSDGDRVTAARQKARKIDPRYAEGELVRVAGGRHQAEAEMIQGMLLEEGVPSILRRSPGFDVPDFLAAGPRDVIVPLGGYEAARDVLLQADLAPREGPAPQLGAGTAHAVRLTAAIAGGAGLATLAAWWLSELGA